MAEMVIEMASSHGSHGADRVSARCCPSNYKWVIIPLTIDIYRYITNKNHSEIGLMFTNLPNELGHQPVPSKPTGLFFPAIQGSTRESIQPVRMLHPTSGDQPTGLRIAIENGHL